jgi:DNA-binding GntR family transcriptional regulator
MEMRAMAVHLDHLTDRSAAGENSTDFLFETQMYHLSFHMRIAECTGCAALCDLLAKSQVLIFNWFSDLAADQRMPKRWHQQLANEIATTDPDLAEAAMCAHVRYGIENIQAEIVRRFGTSVHSLEGIRRPGRQTPFKANAWRTKATAAR